MNCHFNNLF